MNEKNQECIILQNGIKMPVIGYGTMPTDWTTGYGDEFIGVVKDAIKAGYRNIDTAVVYNTEEYVGEAVRQSVNDGTIKRQNIFVSTKVWNTDRGYDKTLKAFDASMKRLGLEYLDLYLIHTPAVGKWHNDWKEINHSTWKAFEKLYKDGRVHAIGVCNFLPHHLQALMDMAEIMPMVNQIEMHPGFTSAQTVQFCKDNKIAVEAWGPFGNGQILQNETLVAMAEMYGKSVAQICLRWLVQQGIIPIPKSINLQRMKENLQVFDFMLSDDDMQAISALSNCGGFCVDADNAPED